MWLTVAYDHTSLFSLKNTNATSSGGKTNLVPTMYSVKLAIIDALYKLGENGEEHFNWIKELTIRFSPPQYAIINNSFIKILREPKEKQKKAFISSIAYREFVYFSGELKIALELSNLKDEQIELLKMALVHINYFGKKGSFVQFKGYKLLDEYELSDEFTWDLRDKRESFNSLVVFQHLDDIGEKAKFSNINTFDESKNKLGMDRILIPTAIPYVLKSSSRGYSYYHKSN
ncbi:hypothetical protein BHF71_05815 [Vulcanibacillus modesticaldus]|uniref:Uncharacterized protein n=1 Tax=Vulcanibacillus modesticaldus TaxID=337097 RepID=A0A1D2YX54_9BACI|nr:hypothetical protein [Vulcanibacillus modesticaldus]OEG00203.1 hypothetical protein BHF71_05815 [Vulcanibacillus modesticaldus]